MAALDDGNAGIQHIITQQATHLGIALTNLLNTLNLQSLYFGGIFGQYSGIYLPLIRNTVQSRTFADLGSTVEFKAASFGRNAGIIGAAALALETFFYNHAI